MSVTSTSAPAEPQASLRERKKQATRRALRRVALDLIAERGFSQVTVEDIAAAADVSPRTFFNYFPSKEAALFGIDPDRVAALRERVLREAPGQPSLDALRVVLAAEARTVTQEAVELDGDPAEWLRRMKAVRADPQLRAAQAAHMALLECALTEALAERLGTDPEGDPYPALLAGVAVAVIRSTTIFWATSGGAVPLDELTDQAFRALAAGLPDDTAMRQTSQAAAPRKDNN
jgi:AcrR family transcriptional regulator